MSLLLSQITPSFLKQLIDKIKDEWTKLEDSDEAKQIGLESLFKQGKPLASGYYSRHLVKYSNTKGQNITVLRFK